VARNITAGIFRYNTSEQRLSITMGFALDLGTDRPAIKLFREAEDNMYREKLHQHKSSRSALVQTLAKTLDQCDLFQEDHIGRMQDLVSVFGKAAGLPDHKISDLRLFAQLHDLGKVGVPDHILLKPSPLTVEERTIVQTHSEQGYQIALSSHDLAPIADWMLKHHEWWNGQGYPLGLKGEEIPFECRILAIADAYDAMTSNRPYRKSLTHEKAISQLKEFSGIQFDPLLVQIFINIIE
jgi:HD-GYP domain-containing protein (c-di-GMP phosphodiesterase class II)